MTFQRGKSRVAIGGLVVVAFLLILTGCGGEPSSPPVPLKGKPTPVEKKTPGKAPEKTEIAKKEEPEYTYDPTGKPDPFKPFIQLSPTRASAKNIPLTPLQRYEISQLKLVAIIATHEGNVALVEDSAGKGYFLKKGTAIGKNDGKVTKILKDRVIIEELEQDMSGQTKPSEVLLYLHRPEEGTEP